MYEVKVDPEVALQEVNALLDKKKLLPKRREALQAPIDAVAEAVSLGFVEIAADGSITHNLIDPIVDVVTREPVLSKLTYKARLDPATVNKKLGELKALTQVTQTALISTLLTDQPIGIINKMEPQDRNICDCISLFFI